MSQIRKEAMQILERMKNVLDNAKIKYTLSENDEICTVFNPSEEAKEVQYSVWELYLTHKISSRLGATLDFCIITNAHGTRLKTSTKANYDFLSAIKNFNIEKNKNLPSDVLCIYLGENLTKDNLEMSLSTLNYTGTYCHSGMTRSEVLFSLVYSLEIERHEKGHYYFPSIQNLYTEFKKD